MNDFLPKLKEKLLSIAGWFCTVLFGVVFVYSLFDEVKDDLSMVLVCLLFTLLGIFMIFRSGKMKARQQAQLQKKEAEAEELQYVSVICSHCGAPNRIKKGAVAKCEYCGSYLQN